MRRIAVLGSTGSIGRRALDLAAAMPEEIEVVALAARRSADVLARQARRFRPRMLAVAEAEAASRVEAEVRDVPGLTIVSGPDAAARAATHPDADLVLAAVVGAAGLPSLLAAVGAGKDVALANKEALVIAGNLVTRLAGRTGATLIPVDSEHCALHQCLRSGRADEVERLILTASGGPFRERDPVELERAAPEEALRHPRWDMGAKISVDSATLMNKGLEVIEAHWLFGIPPERIEVVVHPQSLVHSMVEFRDGSLLAQLSATDMTLPIQYALTWPRRLQARGPRLDPSSLGPLEFERPDRRRFPCLGLAYAALREGGGAAVALNAANEVAVEAFLNRRTAFPGIFRTVEWVMDSLSGEPRPASLDEILALDSKARAKAAAFLEGI